MISSRSCGRTTAKGSCRRPTEAAATATPLPLGRVGRQRDGTPPLVVTAGGRGAEPAVRPRGAAAVGQLGEHRGRQPGERPALGRPEPRERGLERRAARALDPLGRRHAGGREPHQHAAAVGGVALARREPGVGEPVDHPHGARVAQAQAAGERVHGAPAGPLVQRDERRGRADRSWRPRPRSRRGSGPPARRSSRRPHWCRDPSVPKAYMLSTHMIDEDHRDDPWDKAREAQRDDVAGIFAPRERRCPACGADQRAERPDVHDLRRRPDRPLRAAHRPQHPPPAAVRRHRRRRADRRRASP